MMQAITRENVFITALTQFFMAISAIPGDDDPIEEGDWSDEDDEDFDDLMESETDLNNIQIENDYDIPDEKDDDHLPNDNLQ
jgi:hypothetical protein